MKLHPLCRAADLPIDGARGFSTVGSGAGTELFVVYRGDRIRLYLNCCPHSGGTRDRKRPVRGPEPFRRSHLRTRRDPVRSPARSRKGRNPFSKRLIIGEKRIRQSSRHGAARMTIQRQKSLQFVAISGFLRLYKMCSAPRVPVVIHPPADYPYAIGSGSLLIERAKEEP